MSADMTAPLTTNALTGALLVEIPRRFPGARCWRNNVGAALPLTAVRSAIAHLHAGRIPQALGLLSGRPVHFGLKGQADISGIMGDTGGRRDRYIEHHLSNAGRRLEVEIKCGADKMREDQEAFRAMILRAGGIHVIARDLGQAIKEIEGQL